MSEPGATPQPELSAEKKQALVAEDLFRRYDAGDPTIAVMKLSELEATPQPERLSAAEIAMLRERIERRRDDDMWFVAFSLREAEALLDRIEHLEGADRG